MFVTRVHVDHHNGPPALKLVQRSLNVRSLINKVDDLRPVYSDTTQLKSTSS